MKQTPSPVGGAGSVLGPTSPEEFLSRYWQREPLLVRAAVPDYQSPVSADELAGLALEVEVESRLVLEQGESGPWELRHGPFVQTTFSQLPESRWTLLVQGLELWVPEVAKLFDLFNFLPRWRFDDVMASFAVPGGSVGPHVDQYDVFLLQVEGRRKWQIGQFCSGDEPLVTDADVSILADFAPTAQWTLEPGDMLYLPPRLSHWGVAEDDCMTFSIGLRSPTLADLLGDLAVELVAQGNAQHYQDPPLTLPMASLDIAPEFIEQARAQLRTLLDDTGQLEDWFARFMTAPKYPGLEEMTGEVREARVGGKRYLNGELTD